ncbi:MAG: hypothetical protein A4E53_00551 [Pelotomaculum sp. PtaB.Bin104]|nr:MAG: hypothetical protein A4E53_00551 [Pelotomaculum sp. PtaB.Bin104]
MKKGVRLTTIMQIKINGIAFNIELANTFLRRTKGLMGRKTLYAGTAMAIYPCFSIHTWFMRFPIDVVFLNKNGVILRIIRNMAPYRISPFVKGSYYVVEMLGGVLPEGIEAGQVVEFDRKGGNANA